MTQPTYQEQLAGILRRFGSAYDGEEGLLFPPEEHVEAAQRAINGLNASTIGPDGHAHPAELRQRFGIKEG